MFFYRDCFSREKLPLRSLGLLIFGCFFYGDCFSREKQPLHSLGLLIFGCFFFRDCFSREKQPLCSLGFLIFGCCGLRGRMLSGLQNPRGSAVCVMKKWGFRQGLFEDRLKPPVGGIPSARALPFALPHVLASRSVSCALC